MGSGGSHGSSRTLASRPISASCYVSIRMTLTTVPDTGPAPVYGGKVCVPAMAVTPDFPSELRRQMLRGAARSPRSHGPGDTRTHRCCLLIAETASLSFRQGHFVFPGRCRPEADLVDACYSPSCQPLSCPPGTLSPGPALEEDLLRVLVVASTLCPHPSLPAL